MVFISFPNNTTSEEENLLKKYEKLAKKRKSLENAVKPEPQVVTTSSNKPLEAKDARIVIEKLKKTGQLPMITSNRKSEFKRKLPQTQKASKQVKVDDVHRDILTYDDNEFL